MYRIENAIAVEDKKVNGVAFQTGVFDLVRARLRIFEATGYIISSPNKQHEQVPDHSPLFTAVINLIQH